MWVVGCNGLLRMARFNSFTIICSVSPVIFSLIVYSSLLSVLPGLTKCPEIPRFYCPQFQAALGGFYQSEDLLGT